MARKHRGIAWSTLGLVLALAAGTGAAQDEPNKGTGRRLGETLDSAVQSIKRGARETGETLREQFDRARVSVHNMSVSSRVYSRLHWDKALNDAQIDLEVRDDGVTTLRGTVVDAKAKAKALELAQDTVGVARVIDQLTIRPAPEPDKTTTTTTKSKTTTTVTPKP
jgi:hyperosmotically inducible periplasmic protein